jgi:hypothetical protein
MAAVILTTLALSFGPTACGPSAEELRMREMQAELDQAKRAAAAQRERAESAEQWFRWTLIFAMFSTGALVIYAWIRSDGESGQQTDRSCQFAQRALDFEDAIPAQAAMSHTGFESEGVVIDGMNLACGQEPGRNPKLGRILAVVEEVQRAEIPFVVYFDASMGPNLKSSDEKKAYERLLERGSDCFKKVPSGERADNFILDRVERTGWLAISNDRFRDHASQYSWIEDNAQFGQRRFGFEIERDLVIIPRLNVRAKVPGDILQSADRILQQCEAKSSAGTRGSPE